MTDTAVLLITPAEAVIGWREHVLTKAGYTPEDALLLAVAEDVDLHQAVYLAEVGCPSETALEILL